MFVPRTKGGKLLSLLREEENKCQEVTGYKIKLVERSGAKLSKLLVKSDPWQMKDCQKSNCSICQSKQVTENWRSCQRRSAIYQATCQKCKEKGIKAVYLGETGRASCQRIGEHLEGLKYWSKSSMILRHNLEHHPKDDPQDAQMTWEVLKFHRSSFTRQLDEAVLIADLKQSAKKSKGKIVALNRKEEYNRCLVPGLGDEKLTEDEEKAEEELTLKIEKLSKVRKAAAADEEESNHQKKRKRRRTEDETPQIGEKEKETPSPEERVKIDTQSDDARATETEKSDPATRNSEQKGTTESTEDARADKGQRSESKEETEEDETENTREREKEIKRKTDPKPLKRLGANKSPKRPSKAKDKIKISQKTVMKQLSLVALMKPENEASSTDSISTNPDSVLSRNDPPDKI